MQLELLPGGGTVVATVASGSAGELAGIEPGDQIVSVAGQPVNAPADISTATSQAQVGQQIPIEISRGSTLYTTEITFSSRPGP